MTTPTFVFQPADDGSFCSSCGDALTDDGPLCVACRESEPPMTDVCPSCGDQLTWEGPGLCAACQAAQLTCPQFVALAVRGAE
jgi:predicted amidophosphoribosyltransferase